MSTVRLTLVILGFALRHPLIAVKGAREFRSSVGMTYDDSPWSPKSEAYDAGREMAHIVTLRRWDW